MMAEKGGLLMAARSDETCLRPAGLHAPREPPTHSLLPNITRPTQYPPMSGFILAFDLDGTLIDSVPDLTSSLNRVLTEHGYGPLTRDEVKPMVGDGVPALVGRAFAARGGSPEEATEAL